MKKLEPLKPWFIEEPTAPDDVVGHAAIRKALKPYGIGVATGEHAHNRVSPAVHSSRSGFGLTRSSRWCSNSSSSSTRLTSARSTPVVSGASTRFSQSCSCQRSMASRCALMQVVSGCANMLSVINPVH